MAKHQGSVFGLSRAEIRKQISLPFSEAFKISWRNIRIRWGRALVTVATTFLSVAFLMSVLTMVVVSRVVQKETPGAEAEAGRQLVQLGWLIVMAFIICGIGITNAMLMAVTERYKEIGTIKCLGALDDFIVKLFLIESALMGLVGSAIGALTGMLVALLMASFREVGWKVWVSINWGIGNLGKISEWGILTCFAAAVILGTLLSVIFAVPTAYVAARLPAAEALRKEI